MAEKEIVAQAPSTNELLMRILAVLQSSNPATAPAPARAYDFKKSDIATNAAQSFNFDFIPANFFVYVLYDDGTLAVLFREGQYTNIIATDSDAFPLFDGMYLKVPAREATCTVQNLSGSTVTVIVWALGPGADVEIGQALTV